MATNFDKKANVFGAPQTPVNFSYTYVEPPFDIGESAAAKLINLIKNVADNNLDKVDVNSDWLSISANSGQDALVNGAIDLPTEIDGSTVLNGWTLPPMPTLQALPAAPDNLKIDFGKLKADVAIDIDALQSKWIAKFLPNFSSGALDLTTLNNLTNNVLNGQDLEIAVNKFDTLEADLKAELKTITDKLLDDLNAQITENKTNLDRNIGTAKTNLNQNSGDAKSQLTANYSDAISHLDDNADAARDHLQTNADAARDHLTANKDDAKTNLTEKIDAADEAMVEDIDEAKARVGTADTLARSNVQNIAWARGRDQVAREAARQEAEAVSSWASRGFSLPGGVLTAQIQRARQAALNAAAEFAATQSEKTQVAYMELARQTIDSWFRFMDAQRARRLAILERQNAMDLAILDAQKTINLTELDARNKTDLTVLDSQKTIHLTTLENQNRTDLTTLETKNKTDLTVLDAKNTSEQTRYKAMVDSKFKIADINLDTEKTKAKQAFDHLGLTLDFTRFGAEMSTKYRLGVNEAMNNLIRSYATLMGNEREYIDSIARAEQGAQAAILDFYRAALASADLGLKVKMVNNENDLKFSQIAGAFIGQAVGHHVQAAGESARLYAQIAGQSLAGLNGIATVAEQL